MTVTYSGENLKWLMIYFFITAPCLFYTGSVAAKTLGKYITIWLGIITLKRVVRGQIFAFDRNPTATKPEDVPCICPMCTSQSPKGSA